MSECYDIAVVGAGVAGAMSAVKLSRRGYRVLLIDKAKRGRDKVCGCCLNARALAALRSEGFGGLLMTATPLHHAELFAAGRSAAVGLPEGVALSRRALDAALIDAAEHAGCTVWDQAIARLEGRENSSCVTIAVKRGGTDTHIQATAVIVADGLAGSTLTGHAGFARIVRPNSKRGYGTHLPAEAHDHPAGRITMRCGRSGYLGAVVLEDGALDLAAAIDPRTVKHAGGIAPAVQQLIDASGRPLPVRVPLDGVRWGATPPLTGTRPRRWSAELPGVLLVGDSAGYIEPFTGEGMAWALGGAEAVMPIVERILKEGWTDAAGAAWDAAYRRMVSGRQWRCRATAAVLRRPGLTAGAVGLLGALPGRLRPMVDRLVTPGRLGSTASREAACPL